MIKQNINLKDYSNFKTGGNAALFFDFASIEELIAGLKEYKELDTVFSEVPFVVSAGTNVLVSDKGYNGLVLHNMIPGLSLEEDIVTVGAGVTLSELLDFCIENELSGLEWAGGLPGTIGGAVRGNAGAFCKETKDSILSVRSLNYENLQITERSKEDCQFSYRNSFFKSTEGGKEIITQVKLRLGKGKREEIKQSINEKREYRIERHPLEYPTLGSTFKNVPYDSLDEKFREEFKNNIKNDPFPVIPVVKFLIGAGLKGYIIGGAQLAEKHPNFIINLGNAKSEDARQLIQIAKQKVKEKYGVVIEEEIIYLGKV